MAVEFRAGFTAEANAATVQSTITAPAVAGDVAVAVHTRGTSGTITPPAGWTRLGTDVTTTSQTTGVFYKVLTSGDIGVAQTWTVGAQLKHAVAIAVYSGVDTTTPVGGSVATLGATTTSATRVTPAGTYTGRAIEFATSKGTTPGTFTPPASHTARASIAQSSSGSVTACIADSTTDLDGGNTFTLAAAWPQGTTGGLWLNAGAPPTPSPGAVLHLWTGAPTAGGFSTVTRTTGATSVRLAVSTSPSMTSPTYLPAQTPDAYGYVRHAATGLAANTRYWVQAADTPTGGTETLVGTIGTIRTLAPAGTATARTLALGACIKTNGSATETALADALTWAPDYGLFTGDFFYNGGTDTTESVWVGKYGSQIAAVPNLPAFVAAGLAAFEAVSDHDTTNVDNGDSNTAWAATEQAAWRKVVPYGTTGATDVRDRQWDDGRVSYFLIDCRSPYRSPGADADTSAKTMLGTAQRGRLLAWLSSNPAPFKVIVSDVGWMGNADTVAKPDAWWSYATERQTIIDAVTAAKADTGNPTLHVELWHGDSHLIGYATAAKNTWGGFPVICAAGYDETGGGRNTSTFTEFWNNGATATQQYGRVAFTDDGTTITRTFTGWGGGAERMTFTTSVAPPASGSAALSGSGSLAASGTPSTAGAVTLAGSGALAASGVAAPAQTAALSGAGALSATGTPTVTQAASLTGSGSLTATGRATVTTTATLTGAGLLTAVGSASEAGSATAGLSGTGTLTATGRASLTVTAGLTGTGALAATGRAAITATAAFAGAGTLTAEGLPALAAAAQLAGLGTLTATGSGSSEGDGTAVPRGRLALTMPSTGLDPTIPATRLEIIA